MPTKEQRAEYMRQWLASHRDHVKDYREQTREARNTRRRELYALEPERRARACASVKDYRAAKPHIRKAHQLRAFGLTLADFREMMERQGNGCAICGEDGTKCQFPAVDHDHLTGKVRGLLCMNCNQGIGKFHDSPETLRAAADYLSGSSGADSTRSRTS